MKYGRSIEGHPASYWSQKSGIDTSVIYERYFALGWSLKKALSTPAKKYGITHKGTYYKSFDELCYEYGKKPGTVRDRMSKGYSLDDALTIQNIKKMQKEERQRGMCGCSDCFECPYDDCIMSSNVS